MTHSGKLAWIFIERRKNDSNLSWDYDLSSIVPSWHLPQSLQCQSLLYTAISHRCCQVFIVNGVCSPACNSSKKIWSVPVSKSTKKHLGLNGARVTSPDICWHGATHFPVRRSYCGVTWRRCNTLPPCLTPTPTPTPPPAIAVQLLSAILHHLTSSYSFSLKRCTFSITGTLTNCF